MSQSSAGPLAGRVVLITGGARGIGRACCEAFAQAGASVALCDVDLPTATATQEALTARGLSVQAWQLDVRDRAAWEVVVRDVEARLGPVEVLVGNAGIMPVGSFLSLSEAQESRQVDINLNGLIHGIHAVLPGMQQRESGHLVQIASLAGRVPTPYGAVYAATKFGAVGLGESLRHELEGTGIHVTTVMPGFVQTELISGLQTPSWPKPSTPAAVAEATLKGVLRRKGRVYLPWFASMLVLLPWILPHWMALFLSRLFGVHQALKPADEAARSAYRERAAREP